MSLSKQEVVDSVALSKLFAHARRLVWLVFALAACEDATLAPDGCDKFEAAVSQGVVTHESVQEISGLAVSSGDADVLWAHNDSGDGARFYALDGQGQLRAVFELYDVVAEDWEDVAIGGCGAAANADHTCLYFADVGDNLLMDSRGTIHRVFEPDLPPRTGGVPEETLGANFFHSTTFTWPHGPRDVEALVVLPDGRLVMFTKRDDATTELYRLDLDPAAGEDIIRLGTIALDDDGVGDADDLAVTAADLTRNGQWLLLRTLSRVYAYDVGDVLSGSASGVQEGLDTLERVTLPAGSDAQGESIAWAPDGGFWHTSEGVGGALPRLWFVECGAH